MFLSETLHQFRVPAAAKGHDSAVPVFSGPLLSGIAKEVLEKFSSYFSLSLFEQQSTATSSQGRLSTSHSPPLSHSSSTWSDRLLKSSRAASLFHILLQSW